MTIQTNRTRLRRFRADDLENMIRLDSDADVMRFTPSRFPLSRERSWQRLQELLDKEKERAPLGVWAAELKTGEFVGWFMIQRTGREFPELGFMIAKKHWGQGLTTEIAQGLIDFAAQNLGVCVLDAVVTPENEASTRVLEKLGFRFEKSFSQFDETLEKDIDLHLFRLDPLGELKRKAIATLEANKVQTSRGLFLAAGGYQFRTLWVRDFCFSVPGLLAAGWQDLVKRQLDLILSYQTKEGLLPRGLDIKNPKSRVLRHTALRFLPAKIEDYGTAPLIAEYLGEHGTPAFDSGLLWIKAWSLLPKKDPPDDRAAIEKILNWYLPFFKEGLLRQPGFSDWQDSARREGACLHTHLLFLQAVKAVARRWPDFKIIFDLSAIESAIDKTFRRLPSGLLAEFAQGAQSALDSHALLLTDSSLLPHWDRAKIWTALKSSDLMKKPGTAISPAYASSEVSWTTKAVGLRHYHDLFQWGWLMAELARTAYLMNDRPSGDAILHRLARLETSGLCTEVFHDGKKVQTLLYSSENPFTWTAAKVLEALQQRG